MPLSLGVSFTSLLLFCCESQLRSVDLLQQYLVSSRPFAQNSSISRLLGRSNDISLGAEALFLLLFK